ncbi:RidA family protein (plasmid) [Roseomonas sp. CCTCC AB2023176]|uniref:RidA family protein n=1 Tax=Roseomonas sp. CCTCC AB2023176 TaxID=3342640 RepID=UPI0035D88919
MTATVLNPASLPSSNTYSHGFAVEGATRTIYCAGQVGVDRDGNAPAGIAAQTELAFKAVEAILREGGLELPNVVKTTVFLLDPSDYAEFARVRSAMLGTTKPASTLVYVKALVKPEWIVEVEAIAVG